MLPRRTAAQKLDQNQVYWCTFLTDCHVLVFRRYTFVSSKLRSFPTTLRFSVSITLRLDVQLLSGRGQEGEAGLGTRRQRPPSRKRLVMSQVKEPVRGPVLPADPVWSEPSCSSLDRSHSAELIVSSSSWVKLFPGLSACFPFILSPPSLPPSLPLSLSLSLHLREFTSL